MFYDVPAVLKGSMEMKIISLCKAVYSDNPRFNFLPQKDFHVENLFFLLLLLSFFLFEIILFFLIFILFLNFTILY